MYMFSQVCTQNPDYSIMYRKFANLCFGIFLQLFLY